PLSLIGLLQYIGPSIQLLLGVWMYHEPFTNDKLICFTLIWLGLALYSGEALLRGWRLKSRSDS
ncbi:MAG: EamA family transporter RarD, partial [Burkholderiaceae bacterium]